MSLQEETTTSPEPMSSGLPVCTWRLLCSVCGDFAFSGDEQELGDEKRQRMLALAERLLGSLDPASSDEDSEEPIVVEKDDEAKAALAPAFALRLVCILRFDVTRVRTSTRR